MKISKKDMYLLIGFTGVLLALIAAFWVYLPTMEKADALQAENLSMEAEIAELQSKNQNKETYQTKTREMAAQMDGILQLFPVELKEEDAILLTLTEELLSPMTVETLTMNAAEPVDFEVYEQESEDAEPVSTGEIVQLGLYRRPVTMQFVSSYEALKRYVNTVVLQTNRTKIVSVTASYDESTGLLNCVASINMYYITGQDGKTYVQPDFSSVITGTDNPFGTIVVPYEEDVAELAEQMTGIEVEDNEEEDEDL